uniref:Arylsulfatase n=1 Tax=Dicathais orbita TaxID=69583 RepID=D9J216_9CAEN|nr:arylsulfatase [Dicathais orbita]
MSTAAHQTMSRMMLLLPLLLTTFVAAQNDRPPNFLYIMADDLGYNDVSWHNPQVLTPNLGKMAKNGVILTESYSQAACTPSRASYMTGYYPFRIGVQNSVVREGMEDYVPLDVDFLPKRLKEAGYVSHLVGKWHLGHCRRDVTPPGRGFDTFLGLLNGYNDYYTKKIRAIASHEDFDPNAPGTIYDFFSNYTLQPSPETDYTTDIFTNRAIELIQQSKDTPFFLALHYTAPHWPLQKHPGFSDKDYPDVKDLNRRIYLSSITAMDTGIGKVVDALKQHNLLDNTLIVFQSDNGGDTHFSANNGPLRDRKTTLYEGGVKVPSMAYGPGLLTNTPRTSDDLFHISDWFTTILSAAGLEAGNVDGIDQWNLLRYGSKSPRQTFIYNIHGDNAAIRAGRYKLIEGNPKAFQARRRRRSVDVLDQDLAVHGSALTRHKRDEEFVDRRPYESDEDKVMKAFSSLTGLKKLEQIRPTGDWTMDSILSVLEKIRPDQVKVQADCHKCQLYNLTADPSEKKDLVKEKPAVVLFMHTLLELYKAEEVEPVLAYPFKKDARFRGTELHRHHLVRNRLRWTPT